LIGLLRIFLEVVISGDPSVYISYILIS